jgi:leucyl aminopeptidase (aminopeptidase T)
MIENAGKPLDLNIEDGDEVVFVTDTAMDPQMWQVVLQAARARGIDPTVVMRSELEHSHEEPSEPIRKAMFEADVVVFLTDKTMVHSHAAIEAMTQGIKGVALEEITPEIITGSAASADYDTILEHSRGVRDVFTEGSRVEITTPLGMDLEASIEGRPGFSAVGKVEQQPSGIEIYAASFPDGEVAVAPVEETVNGTIIWDTTMNDIDRIDEPIEANVENGYVTEIRGSTDAAELRRILESVDDRDSWGIGEIAVGLNPDVELKGSIRVDKKAKGYLHIALGENTDVGGTLDAEIHFDGVIGNATMKIDDTVVVEAGEMQI